MEDQKSNSNSEQDLFVPDTPHISIIKEEIKFDHIEIDHTASQLEYNTDTEVNTEKANGYPLLIEAVFIKDEIDSSDDINSELVKESDNTPQDREESIGMKEQSDQDCSECDKEPQVIPECGLEPEVVVESDGAIEAEENDFENGGELIQGGEDFQNVKNLAESAGGHSSEILNTMLSLPYQNNYIQRYMARHMTSPDRTEGKHKCAECSYSTNVAGRLKAHMVTHTGERPYKCTICPYSSSMAGTLKRHMATHSGDKPYKCPVCPYSGGQPGNLKRHLATHTVIRPYKCSACSYRSATVGTLKIHMKTHTGIRPFECPLCPYRSSRVSTLKIHMVTHTNHKPYKCSECSFSSSEARHLRRHVASHSTDVTLNSLPCEDGDPQSSNDATKCSSLLNDKLFECTECDFKCAYKYVLKRHMLWKHDGLRPYGCAHCHYGSMSKHALAAHLFKYHLDDMM